MWFEKLTGFYEESKLQDRKNLLVNGNIIKYHITGKEYCSGL